MRRIGFVALLGLFGCGGAADTVSPPPPPPPAPVASVSVAPGSASLVSLQSTQLVATTRDASGGALTGRSVTWSSGATTVANVDGNGLVTAVAPGTASITATSEGKTGSAQFSVSDGALLGQAGGIATGNSGNVTVLVPAQALGGPVAISMAPTPNPLANVNLVSGTAYDFGPSGTTFAQPATISIKYAAGLPGGLVPDRFRIHRLTGGTWVAVPGSAVNVGTRTVTAQTSSFSTYAVLQQAAVPTSLTVGPATPTVISRATQTMTAAVLDQFGSPLTAAVAWQSSDQAVATIHPGSGVVTAISTGTTTITATNGAATGNTLLTVVPASLTAIVEQYRAQYNLPAMGAAIVSVTGKTVAIGVSGNRRWGTNTPVTIADKWHLGSNAKSMTSFLAAMTIKAGLLSWNDLMLTRYPQLTPVARPEFTSATLRTLATMQSGITGNPSFTPTGTLAEQRIAVDQWAVQQPPAATPGTFYYSNAAYQILAEIVGRAWGSTGFEQAVRDKIWTPLGITSGGFGPTTGAGQSDQPSGHSLIAGGWLVCEACDNTWATGSGKVHMSLPDWSRFIWEILRADVGQSTLLTQAEARALTTGVTTISAPNNIFYGYGWELMSSGQRIVSHDGSNTKNHSRAVLYLDSGLAFLVTTNASDGAEGSGATSVALNAMINRLIAFNATGQ